MKRTVSLFLFFIIVFILAVPSSAANLQDVLYDSSFVTAMEAEFSSGFDTADSILNNVGWAALDRVISAVGVGRLSSYQELVSAASRVNQYLSSKTAPIWKIGDSSVLTSAVVNALIDGPFSTLHWDVSSHPTYGYVIVEQSTGVTLCSSVGAFPYFRPNDTESVQRIGQWVPYDQAIASNQALWHTVIGADLSAYAECWSDRSPKIREAEDYFYLVWNNSAEHNKAYVLCDDYGYPYYVPKPKQTAVTTPNNYYTEEGDSYTDDSTNVTVYDQGSAFLDSILDVENGILNVGGEAYYVDEINYDDSTKTYYVDSHDSYTWNTTTNNYITNNYKWEITYNIDYTSVTYIGQTEEYEDRYEYYYELPDGRSSADLTREDLEQLSVVFYDVMNYSRTSDNDQMRALYHFDGNTEDSSYWSYTRQGFEWKKGASLTYMDEGVFNGSLYLDETEHQFEIGLPGSDAAADWTLQFRYYQSHTEVPVNDSYLSVGGVPLLYFTGSQYLDKNSAVISASSVGTWNEICLVRSFGKLLYFINGVYYKTVSCDFNWPIIGFYFGSSQQTYKKIDELRFTKKALYDTSGYTPSVVPYDTNLALVLPDAATAVADEYVIYTPPSSDIHLSYKSGKNFNVYDWHWGSGSGITSEFLPSVTDDSLKLYCERSYNTFGSLTGDTLFLNPSISSPTVSLSIESPNDSVGLGNGFFLPVLAGTSKTASQCTEHCYANPGWDFHNLSVILSDGSYSTVGFAYDTMAVYSPLSANNSRVVIEPGYLGGALYDIGSESFNQYFVHGFFIYPIDGKPVEIVDLVLTGAVGHRWSLTTETVLYDAEELTEDPILAVRSNRPITNYQIGGVRPSYPEKGQVYAMVENNRITSLQQYTGYVWEAVDGRIWTGSRWIPYSSFDVKTLQDFYDVEGTSGDDYFYSESGFWSWFQKQWKVFMGKLDQVIYYLKESLGLPDEPDCEHVYTATEITATCSEPGGIRYVCNNCGDTALEASPALGHDWVTIEDIPSEFALPEDAHCPSCSNADFTHELNASQDEFTCTCSVCGNEWKETPVVTYGHTTSECSRCGIIQTESKDPNDNGFFTALGNFLSDGITWILDKLRELVDAISGIQDTFRDFANSMKENVGQYPAFLAAAIAVIPAELMDPIWFAVVALIAVLVYKKVTR